jgi:hypothetical protein
MGIKTDGSSGLPRTPNAATPANIVGNPPKTKEAGVPGVVVQSGWSREAGEGLGNLLVRAKPWWDHWRSEIHDEVARQRC